MESHNSYSDSSHTPLKPIDTKSETDSTSTASVVTPPHTAATTTTPASPGHIILQWLTYAFWGWTLVGLAWLTFVVFLNLINKNSDVIDMLPYALASVLVLLPISLVCDIFYSKREHIKKMGASMIVMIIHAVIFALFGIGALIGTVFSIIQLFIGDISDGTPSESTAVMLSLIVITLLYAATFLRTLNPFARKLLPRIYIFFMASVVVIFTVLAIIGPLAAAHQTKFDREIENNLSALQTDISTYVQSNRKLPVTLADVAIRDDPGVKKLIADKLVEYKNEGQVANDTSDINVTNTINTSDLSALNTLKEFHYQLCVTYHFASTGYEETTSDDYYSSYLSTSDHLAGHVCYKLSESVSSNPIIRGPIRD